MSNEGTNTEPITQPETLAQGTTDSGQPGVQQTVGSQAHDPIAMQADYSRKTQALADERRAFESERQQWYTQQRAQTVASTGYSQQYAPAQTNAVPNDLVQQFGYEGAQAILQREQTLSSQLQRSQIEMYVSLEEMKARSKFGADNWDKHNYFDPATGQTRNKVMDLRLSVNPLTGRTLTIDEAWNAVNAVDQKSLEQRIRDQVYAEMNRKAESMPASASTSAPAAPATGHATSIGEALRQAKAALGS